MKIQSIKLLTLLFLSGLMASCELDNYEAPNASISGKIYDWETNELVRQDIVNGAQIEYIEHGFENPPTQYMIIKNEGVYRNNIMFAGTYTMQLRRGNFIPLDEIEVEIKKGHNEVDFKVQPYIRVKNVKIEKSQNNSIVAEFNLQPTVPNKVAKIGLYAHQQATVGYQSKIAFIEQTLNEVASEDTRYRLELAIDNNFTIGKPYYFIVGALIDAPQKRPNPTTLHL